MTNTEETIMTTKDIFEIGYWVVSLIILVVTVYWIKISPIKAVETGRKLDNEQNKYNAKRDLFLTLFSLRGNPTHYDFVNGLNQIDIVFEDEENVLFAWQKLFDSLNMANISNPIETRNLLRVELLSEMAQSLGYQKLKQTAIQRNYSPQAHADQSDENWNHQQAAKTFFETGTQMHKIWIDQYFGSSENQSAENKKLDS
ncbi:hypothetical protein BWK60_13265 [Flavobacterium covae]|uniref:DUF6680 family protein n=1 Tax=Flavobacterium covae TaxID=2906076 RepID=UPI000B4DE3D4|nr:DUF6680 family protein [Flavobacterium covae]OWP85597.1 hypothetical protein BWK60_13265 [Flavobacterium covae]